MSDLDVNKIVDDAIHTLDEPESEQSTVNLDDIDISDMSDTDNITEDNNEEDTDTDTDTEYFESIDTEPLPEKTLAETFFNTKTMLKKLRPLLIIVAILCFAKVGLTVYQWHSAQMPTSHVFVCDNPKYKSDFDTWISDELTVTWVPTYIIIQDGYVVGAFEGCIPKDEFVDKLSMAVAYNLPFVKIPDYEIENLDGERIKASDVFSGDGPYVLELVWIDCEDCAYQDEHYTDDIYSEITTAKVYRYYVKSEKSKVLEKYK